MELLLWRWSTAVQVTSLVMIAVFFAALGRSNRRAEVRFWIMAWLANLVALGVTLLFWAVQPEPAWFPFARVFYMLPKTAFVLLLIQGAWAVKQPGAPVLRDRYVMPALALYLAVSAFLLATVEAVGFVQHLVMAVLLGVAGLALPRGGDRGLVWLAFGFLIRAGLSLIEAAAYGLLLFPKVAPDVQERVGVFLAASSSLDSATEWLLALGSLLALAERTHRELRRTNQELLALQENLRRMVDRDHLTGLANRRALPEVFRAVQPQGATLLFFDLDGFKDINDRLGHAAGDRHLQRFAAALADSFRPSDALVRFGGDEFLVVASGLDRAAVGERVGRLRERLAAITGDGKGVSFSVGVAELPPGGHPETALQAADAAMYEAKGRGKPATTMITA